MCKYTVTLQVEFEHVIIEEMLPKFICDVKHDWYRNSSGIPYRGATGHDPITLIPG